MLYSLIISELFSVNYLKSDLKFPKKFKETEKYSLEILQILFQILMLYKFSCKRSFSVDERL